MEKITLKTKLGVSQILIEPGLFERAGALLQKHYGAGKQFVIVTDSNLEKIFGKRLREEFPKDTTILSIPPGEEQKNMDTVLKLAEQMLKRGVDRHDVVIGFGGGVITDMAGFLASIYMRGVHFVAIPTSVLCMVDAAIGGKTGVDFHAKNILGTVYLTDFVLIDPDFAKGLPARQISSAMGEIIKYAAMADKSLFRDFEKMPLNFATLIRKSVEAKVRLVKNDIKEHMSSRKMLNYGHTFGHALESATLYALTHGEAISIGMTLANKIAAKLGKQDKKTAEKIETTLQKFGLPTELPKGVKLEALAELIGKDKKCHDGIVDFIIVPKLGKAKIVPLKPEELINLAR